MPSYRKLSADEFASFLRDLKRPGRPRLRLEGIQLPPMPRPHKEAGPIVGVDFVDCDLSRFHVDRARFKREALIQDCSFERVVWDTRIAHARIRGSLFKKVTMHRVITESTIEDSTFHDCRFEDFQLATVRFRAGEMTGLTVTPSHWSNVEFEDVTISGRAKTLVMSGATFNRVDLRDFRLRNSDLGEFRLLGSLRFPTSDESFVIPRQAIPEAERELTQVLSPRGLASFRARITTLTLPYMVIDRSLFTPAPDLPGIDTMPADLDAIMKALHRRRIEEIQP